MYRHTLLFELFFRQHCCSLGALELSEVSSYSLILFYPHGTDDAQKTQPLYCCMAQTTEKTRVT
jgi:hypothetical protein